MHPISNRVHRGKPAEAGKRQAAKAVRRAMIASHRERPTTGLLAFVARLYAQQAQVGRSLAWGEFMGITNASNYLKPALNAGLLVRTGKRVHYRYEVPAAVAERYGWAKPARKQPATKPVAKVGPAEVVVAPQPTRLERKIREILADFSSKLIDAISADLLGARPK